MNSEQIKKSSQEEIERAITALFKKQNSQINLEQIIHEGGACLAINHLILLEKLPEGTFNNDLLIPIKEGIFEKLHSLFPNNFKSDHHWMIEKVHSNIVNSPNPRVYLDRHYDKIFSNDSSELDW